MRPLGVDERLGERERLWTKRGKREDKGAIVLWRLRQITSDEWFINSAMRRVTFIDIQRCMSR